MQIIAFNAVTALVLVNLSTVLATGSSKNEVSTVATATTSSKEHRTPPHTRSYHVPPMLSGRRSRSLGQMQRSATSLASFSSLFESTSTRSSVLTLETTPRIVNGAPVSEKENYAFSAGSQLCGGTLIHEDIILTAART